MALANSLWTSRFLSRLLSYLLPQVLCGDDDVVGHLDGAEVPFGAGDLHVLGPAALGGIEAAFGLAHEVDALLGCAVGVLDVEDDGPVGVVVADGGGHDEPAGELNEEFDLVHLLQPLGEPLLDLGVVDDLVVDRFAAGEEVLLVALEILKEGTVVGFVDFHVLHAGNEEVTLGLVDGLGRTLQVLRRVDEDLFEVAGLHQDLA